MTPIMQEILSLLRVRDLTALQVLDLMEHPKKSQGAVYKALRKMEREQYVESYKGTTPVPERGGRPRIFYRLTGTGKRALAKDMEEDKPLPSRLCPI